MPAIYNFNYEKQYWQQGIERIAGLDEVGMGALAGPVVAGAVIFATKTPLSPIVRENKKGVFGGVNDSKKLTAQQRETVVNWIKRHALAWSVGEASVEEITRFNIRNASHLAMQRAIDSLPQAPDLILVDGTPAQPHPTIPAINFIGGDALVFSIAAASIIAKVHRDNLMTHLAAEYPHYSWGSNKGYGSRLHLVALNRHGPTLHHRPTYSPVARLLTK